MNPSHPSGRYQKGLEKFMELAGTDGLPLMGTIREISPDLERFIMEFAYHDVFTRDGLGDRTRELITISSLATMGHALPQLRVHVKAALNAGCSKKEIVETVLHLAPYIGFPATINAMMAVKEAFGSAGDDGLQIDGQSATLNS